MIEPEKYATTYETESNIPEYLSEMCMKYLSILTGTHRTNLNLKQAHVFELDTYYQKYPESPFTGHWNVPKYGFLLTWIDSTLGIDRHYVILTVDNYGQIINFTFPQLNPFQSNRLISLDSAKDMADSVISRMDLNQSGVDYDLIFDKNTHSLNWTFQYNIEESSEQQSTHKVTVSMVDSTVTFIKTCCYEKFELNMNELLDFEEEDILINRN